MNNIKIESLNINGEGQSFVDGKKLCVKGVLPNEVVDVEIVEQKNNFIKGVLKNICTPSHIRICPKCPYVGECGGCDFMFVNSQDGLEIKKNVIKEYFKDLFSGEIIANESLNNFEFRNKVAFAVCGDKIGLRKPNSHDICEISNCLVANENINTVLKIAKKWIKNAKNCQICHIVVRSIGEHVCICVVARQKFDYKILNGFIEELKNVFGNNFGVFASINLSKDKIFGQKCEHIYGEEKIPLFRFGIETYIRPMSFFQINDDVAAKMYSKVLEEISNEVVIEGYSGAGLLSCIMAKRAKEVYSVEIEKDATKDANDAKKLNNLSNLCNINGDCDREMEKLLLQKEGATVVLDPPRSGVGRHTLDMILHTLPEKIVMISCNPYTLKQNIVFLSINYDIKSFEIFDMFPQTFHIESLVVLKRK